MVLNQTQTKKDNFELTWNHIVLETNFFLFSEEIEAFSHNVNLLEMIAIIGKINKMAKSINSDCQINTGIYFNAIESVFNETPFDDKQLEEYFTQQQAFYKFVDNAKGLIDFDMVQIPFEIEFALFGKKLSEYVELENDEKENLNNAYLPLVDKVQHRTIEIKEFIKKAKQILS
ncbi:MAG: hypothetical protein M0D53_09360 [Flavobacterium sp. JAD_PAG50586_2]|nr:MAG: hypothetical protein M0D53_09360 [Flavobacterium sp. JAD_PAG50586_2]